MTGAGSSAHANINPVYAGGLSQTVYWGKKEIGMCACVRAYCEGELVDRCLTTQAGMGTYLELFETAKPGVRDVEAKLYPELIEEKE